MTEGRPGHEKLNLWVPKEYNEKLRAIAVANDRTVAGEVRRLIRFYLAEYVLEPPPPVPRVGRRKPSEPDDDMGPDFS